MPIHFYAPDTQPIVSPVVMLPQEGSVSGGSKRPLNSYAVLRADHSILVDAPVSWALDGIARLADDGRPPCALVLSHRNLCSSGDAFETLVERYNLPVLLHSDDQSHPEAAEAGVPFADPMASDVLRDARIEVVHLPGHTTGSIVLRLEGTDGAILLAGDSAVGPGPEQSDRTPRLERPLGADEDPRFVETWQRLVSDGPVAAVLPLHGEAYLRAEHGSAFDGIVANVWEGAPMDPRRA